ncbi:hypothetical protein UFOVP823_19 [uncultured Caudovirales phage]|uniref:Uncharacterized protein n=1 Tax=uncultured Caudovirales phage TaxID=2100421 RepID=A0A6J5P841_9CAUD|nr:hypothetical protein UFOVP823_19 [uncultured Caudovirales phage]
MLFLTTLLGGFLPFVPDLLKLFTQAGDRKHEITLLNLRLQAGAQKHLWKMEEISANADIAESVATHAPLQSFGVQLLDKAHASGMSPWLVAPAFILFTLVDVINALVRPMVAYSVFGFYFAYRYACILQAKSVIAGHAWTEALAGTWTENDWAILFTVLGYFFGDRVRQKVKAGK